MNMLEDSPNLCRVSFDGPMTICSAAELQPLFTDLAKDQRSVEISLVNVTEIDSAGIQWLMLVKRERETHNLSFRLTNLSDEVRDVFKIIDLESYFQHTTKLELS